MRGSLDEPPIVVHTSRAKAGLRLGDPAGAVHKFAQADKEAPRGGRNHLRWGQALAKLGRTAEARAQWG